MMPTTARLVAAILYAVLFWWVSIVTLPAFALAEQPDPKGYVIINTVLALVMGWRLGGTRAGRSSWGEAVGQGLTTGAAIIIVALFLHGGIRMITLSLRKVYDGPAEAVIAVFALMIEAGQTTARTEVIVPLLVAVVVIGVVVEGVGRRFK